MAIRAWTGRGPGSVVDQPVCWALREQIKPMLMRVSDKEAMKSALPFCLFVVSAGLWIVSWVKGSKIQSRFASRVS